ncbi:EcsC family protein [Aegicerativicinus sediminis]|uniref:EcsC family protein n=1 Tax=Aegicerativicinus sediminis TaxID=2893202 RepID=UPI001E62D10E|nr:EcsC family protein [Aegicerativicinus sediminis]
MSEKVENTMEELSESPQMNVEDLKQLQIAQDTIQDIGFLMKAMNKVGSTVETGLQFLSDKQREWLNTHIHSILLKILKSNLRTMNKKGDFKEPSSATYKLLVSATGAGSGLLGAANPLGASVFAAELLVSTKFMMRSIMDIARSEGEDIYDVNTQLACLEVFALGGSQKDDDNLDTGYYATRVAMGTALKGAGAYISKYGLQGVGKIMMGSVNPVIKVLGLIASRFTVQVSEKFVAQAVPLVGAAGGGLINYLFIDHFQNMAKAHFVIRRLERKYGQDVVKSYYNELDKATKELE